MGVVEDVIHRPIYLIEFYSAVVDEGKLTRGAWPSSSELGALRALGCRAVVNLCAEREQDDVVRAMGLYPFNVRMTDNEIPTRLDTVSFLAVAEHYPTYVHCEEGKGRTGCMVAAYRVMVRGWEPQRALEEAEKFGLSLPSQKEFIRGLKR